MGISFESKEMPIVFCRHGAFKIPDFKEGNSQDHVRLNPPGQFLHRINDHPIPAAATMLIY